MKKADKKDNAPWLVEVAEFSVTGLSVQTCNTDEMGDTWLQDTWSQKGIRSDAQGDGSRNNNTDNTNTDNTNRNNHDSAQIWRNKSDNNSDNSGDGSGSGDDSGHMPKLGLLWARFYEDYLPCLPDNPSVYGVYYEYESDQHGHYRVLAGSSDTAAYNKNLIKEWVTIEAGVYLCFSASSAAMPDAVVQAWQAVWAYFCQPTCPYRRRFNTDFERYLGLNEVHVHIGVQSLIA